MQPNSYILNNRTLLLTLTLLLSAANLTAGIVVNPTPDTTIVVDRVQVTAIKQGVVLRSQPVASTIFGNVNLERKHVDAIKNLSYNVPNFYIPDYGSRMTSSVYVRGLGARIDQPVVGLNVDNVPVMNKDNFDTELADIDRIEVLRGPQSTLYGRNTMGGVVNIYTLSPLSYEGVRLSAEYSSGDSYRLRASSYYRLQPNLGMAVTGFYTHTGGFFTNDYTGRKCDWERMGGGRWRTQWRSQKGLRIDNTFAFSVLDQGGYPYAYIGKEKIYNGQSVIRSGQISYNDPCGYTRTALSDGLTVRYETRNYALSSITSYQYSNDEMTLDQDFLPLSYFTLKQARKDHTLTEDVVIRSHERNRYRWLAGLFAFYRHYTMNAPVVFKETGIDSLIFAHASDAGFGEYVWDSKTAPEKRLLLGSHFRTPSYGAALYHESKYVAGGWTLTAGLRVDFEHTQLRYRSDAALPYLLTSGTETYSLTARINDHNSVAHTYVELLPKFSALYAFDQGRNLYVTISKGYKAGGFNTQIFSDILEEKLKWAMASTAVYNEEDPMSYKPEYSWNYEAGGHFTCADGAIRGDMALFYIDCRDQQLTVFPAGASTGRMMANAGRTRSYGAEVSMLFMPWRQLDLNLAYGYTHAKFVRYNNGQQDFSGNWIPYAPQHTLSVSAAWTLSTGVEWLGDVVLQAGMRGAGRIWWNEENSLSQPFYALLDASVRIEHRRYSIDLWARNLTDNNPEVFYFKSMGNEFVQRNRPRTFGITLNINF